MRSRHALIAVLALSVAAVAMLAAGCGGSASPSVASLGTSGAGTSTSSEGGSAAGPSTSGSSGGPNLALKIGNGRQFSACMRSHGVPNFPDPDSQGRFSSVHIDVSKQTSAAADEACKHLLSRGRGTATPQQQQQKFTFALKVAGCLRAHGFPNFPDPIVSGQGASENLSAARIDANSPQFQAAQTTCEKQERKVLGLP
jgi:hypothetical protein